MHTKSIPTADTDKLRDALHEIHWQVHTPEGLHEWSDSRKHLRDLAMKGIAIACELVRRGSVPTPCRFCLPDVWARRIGLDVD